MTDWKDVNKELPKKDCKVILNTKSSKYGIEKLFGDFKKDCFTRYGYSFNKKNKYKGTISDKNTIEIIHWDYKNELKETK